MPDEAFEPALRVFIVDPGSSLAESRMLCVNQLLPHEDVKRADRTGAFCRIAACTLVIALGSACDRKPVATTPTPTAEQVPAAATPTAPQASGMRGGQTLSLIHISEPTRPY